MKVKKSYLYDKEQTADSMYRLARNYCNDLKRLYSYDALKYRKLSDLSLMEFFNLVKSIPFKKDKKPIEKTYRPYISLTIGHEGLDCKKKHILMGAFCECNNIPWRIIASSSRPDKKLHHVYIEIKLKKGWVPVDATYRKNKLFEVKKHTKETVL